jgi:hypothetical protein
MLDRPGLLPEEITRETTEAWLAAFDAALRARSAAELSQLFVADGHWRNLFGLSWQFATVSGNAKVVAELLARSAEAGARHFRIDTARLAPRGANVGGRDVLEAIFAFETVNGPGYGAVRLLREADGAVRAGRFRPRSISMPSAPRVTPPPRRPTSGILPAPTGSSNVRPPPAMTEAIPMC